jgi:molecular chaperone DnaJ
MKNYYDILGVSETATQDEIKKAYRQLSKQYHPDVNPNGEEKFKEVAEAYDNVGDENKRRDYDNKKNNPFANMGGGSFDFNSVFEQMMGGQRQHRPTAPDKVLNVFITPVESYHGSKKELKYEYFDHCQPCDSNGGERSICNHCNGQGVVMQKMGTGMFQQVFQTNCPTCMGNGSIITKPCMSCGGVGKIKNTENLVVSIPKNVDNGNFMRVAGKGDYNPGVRLRGDLILKVDVNKADDFEKLGMDLIYYKKLTVLDVITKKQLLVPHPDGDLMINIPKNLNTEKPLRLLKKGYRANDGSGDFYIKVAVTNEYELPDEVQQKLEELLKEFG